MRVLEVLPTVRTESPFRRWRSEVPDGEAGVLALCPDEAEGEGSRTLAGGERWNEAMLGRETWLVRRDATIGEGLRPPLEEVEARSDRVSSSSSLVVTLRFRFNVGISTCPRACAKPLLLGTGHGGGSREVEGSALWKAGIRFGSSSKGVRTCSMSVAEEEEEDEEARERESCGEGVVVEDEVPLS